MCGGPEPVQHSGLDLLLPLCGTWDTLLPSLNLRFLVLTIGELMLAIGIFPWMGMRW